MEDMEIEDEYPGKYDRFSTDRWGRYMWNAFIAISVLYLLASNFYQMDVDVGTSLSFSNHRLEARLNSYRRDFKALNATVYELLACAVCIDDVLYITNSNTSGDVIVHNMTLMLAKRGVVVNNFFNLVQYTLELGAAEKALELEVANLTTIVDEIAYNTTTPNDGLRLEIADLVPLQGTLPNGTLIPFTINGVYTFNYDSQGVFDISNNSFVHINRDAVVVAEFGIYYAGNGSSPEVVCMMFPSQQHILFQDPPLFASAEEGVNVTAIGAPFEQVGTVMGSAAFNVTEGWDLTIQCSIAQESPFVVLPSSYLSINVLSIFV